MSEVSDPAGLPYAGNGPSVADDGTPMLGRTQRVVGGGSDTTSLTSTNDDAPQANESSFATMAGRSAGENSGTGFAQS